MELRFPVTGEFLTEAMVGYRRLACSVLIQAVRDMDRWETYRMEEYLRFVEETGRHPSGVPRWELLEGYGLRNTEPNRKMWKALEEYGDPRLFLTEPNVFTDLIGIDPEKIAKKIRTKRGRATICRRLRMYAKIYL